MKYIFIFYFLLNKFFLIRSPIPNWDLDGQSISITSNERIPIYSKYGYNKNVLLEKEINIEGDTVTTRNVLTIDSIEKEVAFEDIESHYANKYGISGAFVCPKGKFHPFIFETEQEMKPDNNIFSEVRDWDLKCFDHQTNHFLMLYLPNEYFSFYSKCNNNCNENEIKRFGYSEFLDFTLEDGNNGENYKYRFPILLKDGNYLKIVASSLVMNYGSGNVDKNDVGGNKEIIEAKNYIQACFDKDNNNNFYYFTYNDISDFSSGYYDISLDTTNYANNNAISINNYKQNTNSPLSFIDNVEIREMKFIKGTKYVYYKIFNTDKNSYYYGLIDIKLNKVLYNFEQGQDIKFIPISTNGEMLIYSSTFAKKICILKNGDSCNNDCSNIALDEEGNICQSPIQCGAGKIILMPEEICINENDCDEDIYIKNVVNDITICGLCSYFHPDDNNLRFIGGNDCLNERPSHSIFYNQQLGLLKCEDGYQLSNDECIDNSCYERCETCSEASNDINNQKCQSCKDNYILVNGNCIVDSTTTYVLPYIDVPTSQECKNKRCQECDELSDAVSLCTSCDETKYKKVKYTLNIFSAFIDCKSQEELQTKFYYDET